MMDHEKIKNVKVLLVDDDEDDYLIIKKIFAQVEGSPFQLSWTSSIEDAKQLIDKNEHDIYLVDYKLGAHTGLEVLEYAQPESRPQPFILLTGVGNQNIEWQSMKLAASDYLVKGSFDAHLLSRTLYYALQRKQGEEQRIQQLVELNRSKDEFISIASHQLRTPATAVKQYIGILLEGLAGDIAPKHREILEKANQSNERQLRIVSDLLKVASVDAGKVLLKKVDVKINRLVQEVIYDLHNTFESRNQTVVYTPHYTNPDVHIDHESVRMVIENIIDNASKYSEDGTTITVTVDHGKQATCVHIQDEGVGVEPDGASRLFQKFSRIDNPLSTKVGGTGLGLYWAKKIIDLHDGKIEHSPNKTKGTTFTITLPELGST